MTSTKIILLGESGVGKTSFVNSVAGNPGYDFPTTIGASVVMAWHEYKAGTSEQRSELIELWDIGGSANHRTACYGFLEGAAGAFLVHDLSNRRSEENLAPWLTMINARQRQKKPDELSCDIEGCSIPVMLVGCKLDLAPNRGPYAYDRVKVDCRKPINPGSSTSIALAKFFDAAVDLNAPSHEKRRRVESRPF